jgi:hypothetical protein
MKKYVDAILVLLDGAKILWTVLLATSVSLATITHVVTSHNKGAEQRFNESVDDMLDTYDHSKAIIKGDSCIYEKRLAAKEKSSTATVTPKRAVASVISARKSPRSKRTARSSASVPKQPTASTENKPQLSVAEQQRLRGEQEGQHWNDYIDASSLRYSERSGLANFRKPTAAGTISSAASVATYKELILRVQFTLKSGEVLEQEEIVPGFLSPGRSMPFKSKLKVPAHTQSITCVLIGTKYLLAP